MRLTFDEAVYATACRMIGEEAERYASLAVDAASELFGAYARLWSSMPQVYPGRAFSHMQVRATLWRGSGASTPRVLLRVRDFAVVTDDGMHRRPLLSVIRGRMAPVEAYVPKSEHLMVSMLCHVEVGSLEVQMLPPHDGRASVAFIAPATRWALGVPVLETLIDVSD